MQILRWALLTGVVLVLISVLLYVLTPSEVSGYVIVLGVFVGLLASVLTSGNPHGGTSTVVVLVASIVNFLFYTTVSYVVLLVASRHSKQAGRGR